MFPSKFITVDLDVKSRSDLDFLVKAWKGRMIPMHVPKLGRQHWLRLELFPQPKSPAEAIRRVGKLVGGLSTRGRTVWRRAQSKEFDIGIQAGFEERSGEWVLEPRIVKTVAELGARVRFTVYSPLLLLRENETQRRGNSRGGLKT